MGKKVGKRELKRVVFLRERHAADVQAIFADPGLPGYSRLEARGTPAVFDFLLATDPTPKAIYLQSIVRWFLKGAVRIEDARRVRDALVRFDANKSRLDVADRDINTYPSPGDIEALFDGISAKGGPVALDIPEDVLAGAPILASGDDWLLVRLDTPEASTWWADSTSWCTRHPDMYRSYSSRGPLYVLSYRGTKIQASMSTDSYMDTYDRRITPELAASFPEAAYQALRNQLVSDMVGTRAFHDPDGNPIRRIVEAKALLAIQGHRPFNRCWAMMEGRTFRWLAVPGKNGAGISVRPLPHGLSKITEDYIRYDPSAKPGPADMFYQILGTELRLDHEPVATDDDITIVEIPKDDWRRKVLFAANGNGYAIFSGDRLAMTVSGGTVDHSAKNDPDPYEDRITVALFGPDDMPGALSLFDKDGTGLLNEKSRLLLPALFRHVRPSPGAVIRFGSSLIDRVASDRWFREDPDWRGMAISVLLPVEHRTYQISDDALSRVIDTMAPDAASAMAIAASPDVLALSRSGTVWQMLVSRCPRAGQRLLEATKCSKGMLSRRTNVPEATPSDILAISDIPHTGHLLAGVAPEKRSRKMVAYLIAKGRGGCIAALTPALATRENVYAAFATPEHDVPAIAMDSVGMRLLYGVKEAMGWRPRPAERDTARPRFDVPDYWDDIDSPLPVRGHDLPPLEWASRDAFAARLSAVASAIHGGEIAVRELVSANPRLAPYFYPDGIGREMVPDLAALRVHNRKFYEDLVKKVRNYPMESLPFPFVVQWVSVENGMGPLIVDMVRDGAWKQDGVPQSALLESLLAADPKLSTRVPLRKFDAAARLRLLDRNARFLIHMQAEDVTRETIAMMAGKVAAARRQGSNEDEDDDGIESLVTLMLEDFGTSTGEPPGTWRKLVFAILADAGAKTAKACLPAVPWPVDAREQRILVRAERVSGTKAIPLGPRPRLPMLLRIRTTIPGSLRSRAR